MILPAPDIPREPADVTDPWQLLNWIRVLGRATVINYQRLAELKPPLTIPLVGQVVMTNQPAADTEMPDENHRVLIDLDKYEEFRFTINVKTVGATGATLRLQVSPDLVSFANADGATGPPLAVSAVGFEGIATGLKDTSWCKLALAARVVSARLRIMGKDGDGVADPEVRNVIVQFR